MHQRLRGAQSQMLEAFADWKAARTSKPGHMSLLQGVTSHDDSAG